MAQTYDAIASYTVSGSSTTTVTFNSIASSFTDLILVVNAASTGNYYAYTYFNSDTGANYSRTEVSGNGSASSSARFSNLIPITLDTTLGATSNIIHFMNYANSSTYKSVLYRFNAANSITGAGVGLWRNTSTINRIDITGYGATTYVSGSTFTLYGVKSA